MSDATDLVSQLTVKDQERAAVVLQVMDLMRSGKTQKDACEEAHVAVSTYHRWLSESEGLQALREAAGQAYAQGLVEAVLAWPAAVRKTAQAAQGIETGARDQLAAQKELGQLISGFVARIPEKPVPATPPEGVEDDEDKPKDALPGNFRPAFDLNGPTTRQIAQQPVDQMLDQAVNPE